jgi:hypothetical protein
VSRAGEAKTRHRQGRLRPPLRGVRGERPRGLLRSMPRRCHIGACTKSADHHVSFTQTPSLATRPDVAYCGAPPPEAHNRGNGALTSTPRERGRSGLLGRMPTSETRCRFGGCGSFYFSAQCMIYRGVNRRLCQQKSWLQAGRPYTLHSKGAGEPRARLIGKRDMRVVVVGAGALGGYRGGRLAAAGQDQHQASRNAAASASSANRNRRPVSRL